MCFGRGVRGAEIGCWISAPLTPISGTTSGRLRRHFGLLGRAQEEATDVMEGDDGVIAHMAGVWRRGAWRVPPTLQNPERAVEVAEGWLATAGEQDVEFYDRLLALCQWWEDVVTIEDTW